MVIKLIRVNMQITRLLSPLLGRESKATTCLLLANFKMANQISTSTTNCSKNMPKYPPVTHVIFDMDGLLLDTVHLYETIRQEVLSEFGYNYTFKDNMAHQGLLGPEVAEKIVEQYHLPISAEEFQQRSFKVAQSVFANSKLLPDTEVIYEKMIAQIAESYGKKYTKETRLRVLGTNEQMTAKIAVADCGLPITEEEFLKQFRALQIELGKADLMPGAERLVRHLHTNKVPIAVATSSGTHSVEIKTKNYKELFGLFHHVVMGSSDPEVKNGKPAPDIFRVCASRFDDKPDVEKCLVFEDAPNGVTGARAAGMQAVMVPDEDLPPERSAHATLVLKSLLDFKPEEFGLPPF